MGEITTLRTAVTIVLLTVLIAYIVYRWYLLSQSVEVSTAPRSNEAEILDSDVVKERTVRKSEETAEMMGYPPHRGPSQEHRCEKSGGSKSAESNTTSRARENEDQSRNQQSVNVDLSKMEYPWRSETDVSFDEVGGLEAVKDKLRLEVIKPLENREKAKRLGVSAPNIVFHGPPGTGKTYIAKALATELGLPIVALSGSDIQSKWINESASKVNDLFAEASEVAACEGGAVVFLDELDSVLRNRGDTHGHEEDNKVVNEFLTHLEDTNDHNIVFVGATNRLDALDKAGIRAGRIDLKIHVGKPDAEDREAIIRAQLADRAHTLSQDDITNLASVTDDAVAADLEQLVDSAAKSVLSRDGEVIQRSDFV